MKKVLNRPENFVDEMMDGIIAAYGDRVQLLNGDKRVLLSKYPAPEGKVGIVTAGGSGHLPVFLGYVGDGLLDGCAVGNVFASPSAQKMADMIKACDRGRGSGSGFTRGRFCFRSDGSCGAMRTGATTSTCWTRIG